MYGNEAILSIICHEKEKPPIRNYWREAPRMAVDQSLS